MAYNWLVAADPHEARPASTMPAWIPRLILMVILSVIAAVAAVNVFTRLRSLIVWLVISLFLSFALEPAVNWLEDHGWRRGLATASVLFGFVILGAVLLATMIPLIVEQIRDLIRNVPLWLDDISVYTERWFDVSLSTDRVLEQLGEADAEVGSFRSNIAGNLFGFGARLVGGIFQLLTIGLFTFYLVADGPKLRRAVCSLVRPGRQHEVLRAWEVGIEKTGGYFYSRTLLGVISGVLIYIVLRVLGVPFAAPLALWMGVLSQFIPVIGTYLASALPLLVAVLEDPGAAPDPPYLHLPVPTGGELSSQPARHRAHDATPSRRRFRLRDRRWEPPRPDRRIPVSARGRDHPGKPADLRQKARGVGPRPHAHPRAAGQSLTPSLP